MHKKKIIFFVITFIFSAFFLIENLNFLYNQNSILFSNFGANSAVADSYQYFHNFKKVSLVDFFVNYFLDFYNNYNQHTGLRFYPDNNNTINYYLSIFNGNILALYIFNFIFYLFFIYKFSNFFEKKVLTIFLILSFSNIIILGSLSLPNKEILCFFSFNSILLYYLKKEYKFLFLAIFFSIFSRNELLFLIIIIFFINSNFFLKFNIFFIKKSKFFFTVFVYITLVLFLLLSYKITKSNFIAIMIGNFVGHSDPVTNSHLLNFEFFLFFLLHVLFINFFLKFFLKKITVDIFCKVVYLSLFIIVLSCLLPNYYWFFASKNDVIAMQTSNSLGVTLFLFNACMDGLFFLVYPFKIFLTLFGGAFQKINLSSYETIFAYFSQILFFILCVLIFLKKYFIKNMNLFFAVFFILLIFTLPSYSTHRYVWFVYQYFVFIYCYSLKDGSIKTVI
jgi:hypothetical protein